MATEDRDELARIEQILSELDASELALADPPSEVWDAIASTLTPPDDRADAPLRAGTIVEYSIDADDLVHGTGADWSRFADENGAPEIKALDATRALWSYMSSDTVREPWQALVARVRSTGASVKVPFRCDAPDARRWFEVVLTPADDRAVHFRTTLLFEEPREPIALLDQTVERDTAAEAVELCAWCGRGRHGDDWLEIEALLSASRLLELAAPPPLAHGVCGECRDAMAAELHVGQLRRVD